jgi:4-amino-4-deoxy-L-arabinose transferase-like glycosyltransferase
MNKKHWTILFLILILAVFLRFWQLGKTPKGFYLDEAALGYNAYSIMQTGKDEFGKSWPILFRSFGDFKAPVYTYLLIPIYKIFGMSVWSTRVLSAASGVAGIWFVFWLVKNLSQKTNLALITVLLLAISPWAIIFSRTSYETNVAFTFFVIALWSFYKFKKNKKYLILAAIMAALAFLTYHSERVIVPLVFLVLFIRERKNIFDKKNIKTLVIAFVLGFLIILPTVKLMTTPGFLSRLNSLSILSPSVKQPSGFDQNLTGWKNIVFNNRQILQMKEFSSLYTSYFSPRYLFGLGDPGPRSSYPDLAPFLFWELPFFIIGIIWLFKKTEIKNKEIKFLLVLLMIVSPIPASITRDPFSSIRALPLVLPLTILVAIGVNKFLEKYQKIGLVMLIGLIIWSGGKIYLSVFKFNDYFRGYAWEEGIEEMVNKIKQEPLPVVIDNQRGEIYSQILFFTKADPKKYQENNFEVNSDEYYTNMTRNKVKQIGMITVKNVRWDLDMTKDQIIVGDALSINDNQMKEHCLTTISEIKNREGKIIYRIVKTHPKDKEKFVMGDTKNGQIINDCKITTP